MASWICDVSTTADGQTSPRPHASCGCRAASTLPIAQPPKPHPEYRSHWAETSVTVLSIDFDRLRSGSIAPRTQRNEDGLGQSRTSRQLAPSLLDEPKGTEATDYILLMGDDPNCTNGLAGETLLIA